MSSHSRRIQLKIFVCQTCYVWRLSKFELFLSFFVELLEFSEDRHPWESVEEKLDAIRYELLASIIYPFIRPSFPPLFIPSPLLLSLRISLSAPLSVFTSLPAPVPIPPYLPSVLHFRRFYQLSSLCPSIPPDPLYLTLPDSFPPSLVPSLSAFRTKQTHQ